jgi:1,4-alpha-glucan branching enzyme
MTTMANTAIRFSYLTGIAEEIFTNVRLVGSWDALGRFSESWTTVPMARENDQTGCPAYTATVQFDPAQKGTLFRWGVKLDGPAGTDLWGIATEVQDADSRDRTRAFVLGADARQEESYYLTHCRRLGAHKTFPTTGALAALRLSVWAPNARAVEVVFGLPESGYIADSGEGVDPAAPVIPLHRARDGIWESDLAASPQLANFANFVGKPYMFRVVRSDGSTAYRTDLYSRRQIGTGSFDPLGAVFCGDPSQLDGTVSCSVVTDVDQVTTARDPRWGEKAGLVEVSAAEFWSRLEQEPPLPRRMEDLIIYELHVGSLAMGRSGTGTFADAIRLLDSHLVPVGVNAVELLPVAEFGGRDEWGYGNSHHFAVGARAGGWDGLKEFVRECHARGIAVLLDVVYNHFESPAERAQWQYDSPLDSENIYYWFEGDGPASGKYLDNYSTGYAPRTWEENVRKFFISSAVYFLQEFHIDGFRVDLTQALYQNNVLHGTSTPVPTANAFGAKLLREWTRTLRMVNPNALLIAEDHSGLAMVTASPDDGGLGFDASWYAAFYHDLLGTPMDSGASLIAQAGFGDDRPLGIDAFAGSLNWTGQRKVAYHISHDEAGNSPGSHRTLVQAVNGDDHVDQARWWAEARTRVAFGMAALSAGTLMFLFGEEIGARHDYRYNDFVYRREDIEGLRRGAGARLFRFFRDMIAFRTANSSIRARQIEIVYRHQDNRVVAFRRRGGEEDFLVVASLNNAPFAHGYCLPDTGLPDARWREVFNSDAASYGGNNVGNAGDELVSRAGSITAVLPAAGFIVCRRV